MSRVSSEQLPLTRAERHAASADSGIEPARKRPDQIITVTHLGCPHQLLIRRVTFPVGEVIADRI